MHLTTSTSGPRGPVLGGGLSFEEHKALQKSARRARIIGISILVTLATAGALLWSTLADTPKGARRLECAICIHNNHARDDDAPVECNTVCGDQFCSTTCDPAMSRWCSDADRICREQCGSVR